MGSIMSGCVWGEAVIHQTTTSRTIYVTNKLLHLTKRLCAMRCYEMLSRYVTVLGNTAMFSVTDVTEFNRSTNSETFGRIRIETRWCYTISLIGDFNPFIVPLLFEIFDYLLTQLTLKSERMGVL